MDDVSPGGALGIFGGVVSAIVGIAVAVVKAQNRRTMQHIQQMTHDVPAAPPAVRPDFAAAVAQAERALADAERGLPVRQPLVQEGPRAYVAHPLDPMTHLAKATRAHEVTMTQLAEWRVTAHRLQAEAREARMERDHDRAQIGRLEADLAAERGRNQALRRELDDLHAQMRGARTIPPLPPLRGTYAAIAADRGTAGADRGPGHGGSDAVPGGDRPTHPDRPVQAQRDRAK